MRSLILAISACLALTACQPTTGDLNTTNTNVAANDHVAASGSGCGIASNTLADEKVLFTAETAYNIPANAYVTLGSNLPAATRSQVRGYLIQAYNALKLARAAYNAGDTCSLQNYANLVQAASGQAKALLPKS